MSNDAMGSVKEQAREINLEELVKRTCEMRDESNRIANKVGSIVEVVMGSEPSESCDTVEKRPEKESLFNRIMRLLDDIKDNLTRIEHVIDRL